MSETKVKKLPVLVKVVKAFNLLTDDNKMVSFFPGPQYMEAAHAEHWYTALHLEGATGIANPTLGSKEHADRLVEENKATLARMQADATVLEAAQAEARRLAQEQHVTDTTIAVVADSKRALRRVQLKRRA
jgi:hypothetical protein